MRLEAFSVMLNVDLAKVDSSVVLIFLLNFRKGKIKKGILKLVNLNESHFCWHHKDGFLRQIYLADSLRRVVVGSSG